MRTSFAWVRKYKSLIGKIIMALFLAVLISGMTTAAWAEPKDGRGYKKNHKRYDHRRPYYPPHYQPRRVYVPPPVYYEPPPPPPWGITIFAPPIIIRR